MSQKLAHPLPKVAVCLAAFNGVRWIREQLDSIILQQGVGVTVFISVDKSSDGTEEWVDARARGDGHIFVLAHGGRFGSAAQNFVRILLDVDFSQFDYVSFSDQDDIWVPDKLERAHLALIRTGADAYSSNVLAFWPSGRRVLFRKSQPQRRWDFLFDTAGPGSTYVMKVKLVQEIQALVRGQRAEVKNLWMHDLFSYAYARANGYRWFIDEYPSVLYRQHNNNQVGANRGWNAFVFRLRMFLTGQFLTQSALVAQLVGVGNDPFVKRCLGGGRSGLVWLALHSGQCRRRMRDRLLFFLLCLALACRLRKGGDEATPRI